MEFLRVIKDSNDLAEILDIPKGLRNRRVEVIVLPYQETEEKTERESLRGALSKYRNKELQAMESDAWSRAVVERYENS